MATNEPLPFSTPLARAHDLMRHGLERAEELWNVIPACNEGRNQVQSDAISVRAVKCHTCMQ